MHATSVVHLLSMQPSIFAGQVAMLFLSRGELFHEATWALWFRNAAGLLPMSSLRKGTCTSAGVSSRISSASPGCKLWVRKTDCIK